MDGLTLIVIYVAAATGPIVRGMSERGSAINRGPCQMHGDHLSGKPGNVREFDSCQGNVRDFTINEEISGEKSCQGKVA